MVHESWRHAEKEKLLEAMEFQAGIIEAYSDRLDEYAANGIDWEMRQGFTISFFDELIKYLRETDKTNRILGRVVSLAVHRDMDRWIDSIAELTKKSKFTANRIQCNECKDIITSEHHHDCVTCSCGKCMTDGGTDSGYVRRAGNYTDLSEFTYE